MNITHDDIFAAAAAADVDDEAASATESTTLMCCSNRLDVLSACQRRHLINFESILLQV